MGCVYHAYTEREQQFVNHTAPGPGSYCQYLGPMTIMVLLPIFREWAKKKPYIGISYPQLLLQIVCLKKTGIKIIHIIICIHMNTYIIQESPQYLLKPMETRHVGEYFP